MFVQLTSHMESMLEAAYTKYTNWQTKRSQLHVMKRTWPLRMTSRLCMSTYAVLRRLQKITQWHPLQRSNTQCSAVASASAVSKVPTTFVPQFASDSFSVEMLGVSWAVTGSFGVQREGRRILWSWLWIFVSHFCCHCVMFFFNVWATFDFQCWCHWSDGPEHFELFHVNKMLNGKKLLETVA